MLLVLKHLVRCQHSRVKLNSSPLWQCRKWMSNEKPPSVPAYDQHQQVPQTIAPHAIHFEPDHSLKHPQDLEINWDEEMNAVIDEENNASPLHPVEDTTSVDAAPSLRPTFNIAAYVQHSTTLQQLIKLGVDLHKIETKRRPYEYIFQLDFDRDVKPHLQFLTHTVGVSPDRLGWMITKNLLIFKEDLDNLETRCNYLLSKRFEPAQVASIVTRNPFWLMFDTKSIDSRLGHFQKEFELTGNELRLLVLKKPTVITTSFTHLRENTFMMREEFNMEKDLVKRLLQKDPGILTRSEYYPRYASF